MSTLLELLDAVFECLLLGQLPGARGLRALLLVTQAREDLLSIALERRYRQHIWIAQLVYDRELSMCDDTVDDIEYTAGDARPAAAYTKERPLLATRPELAAGWILAHALAGRDDALADAIAASARSKHPAASELRGALAPKKSSTRAIDRLLRVHCDQYDADGLARIRAAANAPERASG